MSKNSKLILGIAAGVAVGVGIYALLQTEEGKKIMNSAKDMAGKWTDDLKDLLNKGKKMADDAEETLEEMAWSLLPRVVSYKKLTIALNIPRVVL